MENPGQFWVEINSVDLFEEALGDHRADHLGGSAAAKALGQR